jgi:hypothetical protein
MSLKLFGLFCGWIIANIVDTITTIIALEKGLGTESAWLFRNMSLTDFAFSKMFIALLVGIILFRGKEEEIFKFVIAMVLLFGLWNTLVIQGIL